MCFQLLGLCAGTCSIYSDLQSCLGVGTCFCVDLRSQNTPGGSVGQSVQSSWSISSRFRTTKVDLGECGSPGCSPEAVDWVLGLGYCGFCDTVSVVMV